ncbi:GNAT family N-acetyltransferase [Streptobacillus ratti]|uniref:GNAT family N-acetyltransferase n=1 Tax=Streptobacillus ratti TaxID=1720557 RepID=UPI000934B152|nr:GNAT family N-acetyltransferase [Streptobacillus ratti]
MEHKGTLRLETDRIILRQFTKDDYEAVFKNFESDVEMTKYLRWKATDDLEVAIKIVDSWIDSYKNDNVYQWAIVPKDLNEPIGTISVVSLDEKINKVHIGYCIGTKWWNLGYTSEALATIIPFFFEEVKVNRIESQYDPNNIGSGKVMLKCGMKYEGTLRQNDWNNQGIVDGAIYGLLASDYFENKK